MKLYNFVYNYGFLSDWMKANPEIKRGEILRSIDMTDYGTLGKWIDGVTMMPMAQMMKFCNRWCVPVSAFFLNEKAEPGDVYAPITSESNIEPAGGWPDASRKAGIKICDPRTHIHMPSRLPEYIHQAESSKNTTTLTEKKNNTPQSQSSKEIERMRYLDIIEKLNDRVLSLSQEVIILEKRRSKKDRYLSSYDMTAEPDPHR